MAESGPLRWQAAKMPRAAQISAETWAKYESLIRAKYQEMSLDELIREMETVHQFVATSRRQYIHRLGIWGIQKQATGNRRPLIRGTEVQSLRCSTRNGIERSEESLRKSKRRRSLNSLGDQDDSPSPHKQPRGSISPILNVPDAGVVDSKAFRDDCASTSPADIELQGYSDHESTLPVPGFQHDPENVSLPVDWDSSEPTISNAPLNTRSRSKTSDSSTPAPKKVLNLAYCLSAARELNNLPSERSFELSLERKSHLKLIADFLNTSGCLEEACDMYIYLSKDTAFGPSSPETELPPYMLFIARTAISSSHCEAVRVMLSESLARGEEKEDLSPIRFLLHILLAINRVKLGDTSDYLFHMSELWKRSGCLTVHKGNSLPSNLHMLVFVYYKLFLDIPTSYFLSYIPDSKTLSTTKSSITSQEFLQFREKLSEIPEEQSRDLTVSIYMRSVRRCLDWCGFVLERAQLLHYLERRKGDKLGFKADMMTKAKEDMALLRFLWDAWQDLMKLGEFDLPPSIAWSVSSQDELGISSIEHLRVCCGLINSFGLQGLMGILDADLMGLYLHELHDLIALVNSTLHDIWLPNRKPQFAKHESPLSEHDHASADHGLPTAERTTTFESLKQVEPTICSSLRSSNPSFRRLKEASRSIMNRAFSRPSFDQGSTTSLQFSVYEVGFMRSNISLSFLSSRLARSLNFQDPDAESMPDVIEAQTNLQWEDLGERPHQD
ncbi:hypothetical protein G7054_g6853 [Neopestalotiopsis clavispora]|nr:hypothetical protein G7054_g6853 [Neopestalotiopsis clavispora]